MAGIRRVFGNTRKIWTQNQWFSPDEPGDGKTFGSTSGVNRGATDFFIQDGSYWGARNITLGYTLSGNNLFDRVFNSARFYVYVQNAFMVTGEDFTGYNPEGYTDDSGSLTTRGVNYGSEPLNRTFTMGINLNF